MAIYAYIYDCFLAFHDEKMVAGRNQRSQRAPRRESDRIDYDVTRNEKPQVNNNIVIIKIRSDGKYCFLRRIGIIK